MFAQSWWHLPALQLLSTDERTCFTCGKIQQEPSEAFSSCRKCKVARYCSEECKSSDWKSGHQECCPLLRTVAAAVTTKKKSPLHHLHSTLAYLLYRPADLQKNVSATMQMLAGKVFPCKFTIEDISNGVLQTEILPRHPGFGHGTSADAPLESCKLTCTMVMLLCAELDPGFISTSASWLARSAGAFDSSASQPQNFGELVKAVSEAVRAAEAEGRSTCVGVAISDLHVYTVPFMAGIAHSFCVVVSPGDSRDAAVQARIFQSFGPPDIGYGIHEWCFYRQKGKALLGKTELMHFCQDFASLERARVWKNAKALYHRLFDVSLNVPDNYPIKLHIRTRASDFTIETLQLMASVFPVPSMSDG